MHQRMLSPADMENLLTRVESLVGPNQIKHAEEVQERLCSARGMTSNLFGCTTKRKRSKPSGSKSTKRSNGTKSATNETKLTTRQRAHGQDQATNEGRKLVQETHAVVKRAIQCSATIRLEYKIAVDLSDDAIAYTAPFQGNKPTPPNGNLVEAIKVHALKNFIQHSRALPQAQRTPEGLYRLAPKEWCLNGEELGHFVRNLFEDEGFIIRGGSNTNLCLGYSQREIEILLYAIRHHKQNQDVVRLMPYRDLASLQRIMGKSNQKW
eukprot:CAMPEP_0116565370 /NCGR_PEP_ID=MMETSP0397-20121206/13861_1 /TAXON_ID=216820 /ORGANISM="Cyclophora tenuis, Strain ECT3854" /LENGTH=265 /DNA_ID=CAMNT_0004092137 /DNA_START=437 /DNA_END=1232 /DNA_ORIENTATION=-